MAISRLSSGNAANGSLSYSGSYAAGDIIVLTVLNTANASGPLTPTGYTLLAGGQDSTHAFAMNVYYKFATSSSETAPTVTNATSLAYAIYRGVDSTTPFSGTGGQAGTGTSISYSGIVTFANPGSDWIITIGVAKGITGAVGSHPPTSNTLVTEYKVTNDDNVIMDTNAPVSSYSFNSKTLSG
jgi:hypothetical protein